MIQSATLRYLYSISLRLLVCFSLTFLLSCSGDNGDAAQPECPDGYTGSNCNEKIVPTRIYITYIEINSAPTAKPDGTPWDVDPYPNDGTDLQYPDMAAQIDNSGSIQGTPFVFREEQDGAIFYTFTNQFGEGGLAVNDVNGQIGIRVIDWDEYPWEVTGAEPMSSWMYFPAYDELAPDFPSVVELSDALGSIARVGLRYEWD